VSGGGAGARDAVMVVVLHWLDCLLALIRHARWLLVARRLGLLA